MADKPLKDRLFTVVILEANQVVLIVHRDGDILRPWAGDFRTAAYFAAKEGGIPVPFSFVLEWLHKSSAMRDAVRTNPPNQGNIKHRTPTLGSCRELS